MANAFRRLRKWIRRAWELLPMLGDSLIATEDSLSAPAFLDSLLVVFSTHDWPQEYTQRMYDLCLTGMIL